MIRSYVYNNLIWTHIALPLNLLSSNAPGLCGLDGHVMLVLLGDLLRVVPSYRLNKSEDGEADDI